MATKEIKQRIVLQGEKEYNQAIREAQRNLKTLRSELKAETAELGSNATAQQKNEARARSLQKQIAEQEKVVKTLRDALKQAKDEYGDNQDVVQKWEQKLNAARASLAGMQDELKGTGQGLQQVGNDAAAATVATKSVADALGAIGSAGESVSDAIEGIFTGMIDVVTYAVGELWDLVSATAAKANNWTDIAGYWGTDAQTIQQYARAVGASANSFEDLNSAVSRIVMGGKSKDIASMLGISDVNYKSEWDYAMAVMDQLHRMQAEGQNLTPIYEQIFGERRSQKVMDLVNDWGTVQDMLSTFNGNETGFGMSDEELSTMNDLWVQINKIEEKWAALKESFAAGLGGITMDLLVNVEGTLDGIADYMNADDDEGRQAALEKIRTNIEEFFRKVADFIREAVGILKEVGEELQGSEDPLVAAIGDILVKVTESLEWMINNQDKVKLAFEAIFGVWLIAKLAAVAGQLSSILMQMEAIKAFKGISGAGGLADAAASAGSSAGASWGAAFGKAVLKAVPWLAGLIALLTPAETQDNSIWDENGNPTGEDPNITMTQKEYEDARERYNAGDDAGLYDENGNRTEVGAQLGLPATQGEADRERWRRSESERYRSEGNLAADWALEALTGGYKGQYNALQEYWDKYRTGTATPEDWTALNSNFTTAESQDALIGVLQKLYTLDRGTEDIPDEIFGLESRWEETLDGAVDRIITKMDEGTKDDSAQALPTDWAVTMTGAVGAGMNSVRDRVTGSDLQRFNGLPALIQSAVRAGASSGVSGIRVQLDGRDVGRMVAPYVSQSIAREV